MMSVDDVCFTFYFIAEKWIIPLYARTHVRHGAIWSEANPQNELRLDDNISKFALDHFRTL